MIGKAVILASSASSAEKNEPPEGDSLNYSKAFGLILQLRWRARMSALDGMYSAIVSSLEQD
jgi:hypothetical protein